MWTGSSPLARGLRACRILPSIPTRIIPARAGFTPCSHTLCQDTWDHPRSRGVYVRDRARRFGLGGSSPLARGLPGARVRRQHGPVDHPRSRGVYFRLSWDRAQENGSSPLARGLHAVDDDRQVRLGIIPARAGFTRRTRRCHQPRPDHPRSRGVYDCLPTKMS